MVGDSTGSQSPYAGLAGRIRPEGSSDARVIEAEKVLRQPIIRVALTPGTFLLRPCIEPCRVLLDGQVVGKLTSRNKFEVLVDPGTHTLHVARGWLGSNHVDVSSKNGDIAQYVCTGHHSLLDLIFGFALLYASLLPSRFFRLRPFRL